MKINYGYLREDDHDESIYEADDKEAKNTLFGFMADDFLKYYKKENPNEQIDDKVIKKIMIYTLGCIDFSIEDIDAYSKNYEDELKYHFYDEAMDYFND